MLSLFKKNKPADLSLLKTDVHSHLIPGIDDGAKTIDHTIGMLLKYKELGYKKVITTPHIISDLYPNTPEIILSAYNKVVVEIDKLGLDIDFEVAAEYFFDDHLFEQIAANNLLTFSDNYCLFEFSFSTPPSRISELIFELKTKSYKPVLAHFERYTYWIGNTDKAKELREKGVLIQINLNSLTGHYGPHIKKHAEKLIDLQLVDLVGTDCHRIEHLQILEKNLDKKYFHKLLALDLLNNKL